MFFGSNRPRWWVLYLTLPAAALVLWLIARDGLPYWANEWLAGMVLLLVCVAVEVWHAVYRRSLLHEPIYPLSAAAEGAASPAAGQRDQPRVAGLLNRPRVIGRLLSGYGELPVFAFQPTGRGPGDSERRGA